LFCSKGVLGLEIRDYQGDNHNQIVIKIIICFKNFQKLFYTTGICNFYLSYVIDIIDSSDKQEELVVYMKNYISDFNQYLEQEKKCSDTTLKAYTSDTEEFIQFLNKISKYPVNASKEDVKAFIEQLNRDGKSPSTINRKLASIRCFYTYLKSEDKIKSIPTEGVKTAKPEKNDIEYLSIEEVELLLSMPDESSKGKRDLALMEMMYATGMRASEVCQANVSDINMSIGFISCYVDKERPRIIPIGRPAKAALKDYLENGSRKSFVGDDEDNDALFVNFLGERITRQGIWKILKYYGDKAGIGDKISPQILRNSFAAHMIINGADLKSLQELMGHEDLAATKLFLSLTKNRIMDVYDRTFPRAK